MVAKWFLPSKSPPYFSKGEGSSTFFWFKIMFYHRFRSSTLTSSGQRQRIALARALLRDPAVGVLKKPAANFREFSITFMHFQWLQVASKIFTWIFVSYQFHISFGAIPQYFSGHHPTTKKCRFSFCSNEVLLLDEPTSALDPKSSALVSQALEQVDLIDEWCDGIFP